MVYIVPLLLTVKQDLRSSTWADIRLAISFVEVLEPGVQT